MANLIKVQELLYENLRLTTTTYGVLDPSQKRYRKEHLDSFINEADKQIMIILNNANLSQHLPPPLNFYLPSASTYVPSNFFPLTVYYFTNPAITSLQRAVKLNKDEFLLVNNTFFSSRNNKGMYSFFDNKIHVIPQAITTSGFYGRLDYYDLNRNINSYLFTPDGLEEALACLATSKALRIRAENLNELQLYDASWKDLMQSFISNNQGDLRPFEQLVAQNR